MAALLDDAAAVGLSRKDVILVKAGWKKAQLQAEDKRNVKPLGPTMTLHEVRRYLSNRDDPGGELETGWTNKEVATRIEKEELIRRQMLKGLSARGGLRAAVMKPKQAAGDLPSATWNAAYNASIAEVEQTFQSRLAEDALIGPAAAEARNAILRENPELLQKMIAHQMREQEKREAREHNLNSLGIFDAEVNAVRNRNMHRVDLRQGLTPAALAKERVPKVNLNRGVPLEDRLTELLEVVTLVIDGPPKEEQFDSSLAGAAVRIALSHRQSMKSAISCPPRTQEMEDITAQMLGRYRQRVHEEQAKLLKELGVSTAHPDTWDQELEAMEQERQEAEADAQMSREAQKARNTEELMDQVLQRLNQIEERLAEQEAVAVAKEESEAGDAASEAGSTHSAEAYRGRRRDSTGAGKGDHADQTASEAPTSRQLLDDGVRPRRLPDSLASAGGYELRRQYSRTVGHGAVTGLAQEPSQTSSTKSQQHGARGGGQEFFFPSEQEMEEEEMPSLPPIMQLGAMTGADVLQGRLERIWGLLEMPMMAKLDMVMKYTSRELSADLEEALWIWEGAAATVVERERLLGIMVDMQETMDSGNINRRLINPLNITDVAMGFLYMSHHAMRAASQLLQRFDDHLTYQGLEYPGSDAVTKEQLSSFVQRAMNLSREYERSKMT